MLPSLSRGNPEQPAGRFTCLNSIGIIRPLLADRSLVSRWQRPSAEGCVSEGDNSQKRRRDGPQGEEPEATSNPDLATMNGREQNGEVAEWSTRAPQARLDGAAKRRRSEGRRENPDAKRSPAKGVRVKSPSRVRAEAGLPAETTPTRSDGGPQGEEPEATSNPDLATMNGREQNGEVAEWSKALPC